MIFKEETAEELRKKTREEIIADIRRDTLILDLMFLEVKRDIEELLAKHKSNPNVHLQPRHPRGTSEGGQWMRGGDSSTPSASRDRDGGGFQLVSNSLSNAGSDDDTEIPTNVNLTKEPIIVTGSDRKPADRINIFVGGAWDRGDHHNVLNSKGFRNNIHGYNYYATNDAYDEMNEFIAKQAKDKKINLIGHSWGGHAAAKVAAANPGRINILVTVDPVNKLGPSNPRAKPEPLPNEDFFKKVRNSVGMWINIHAIGDGKEDTSGDALARIGGPWGKKPRKQAHLFILSPFHHESFDSMLKYKPSINELSTAEILNMLR